jgi:hypothetical protein
MTAATRVERGKKKSKRCRKQVGELLKLQNFRTFFLPKNVKECFLAKPATGVAERLKMAVRLVKSKSWWGKSDNL